MLLRMGSAYESLVQNATIFTRILVSTNLKMKKKWKLFCTDYTNKRVLTHNNIRLKLYGYKETCMALGNGN